MIIVDTSVWVDHIRARNGLLLGLIAEGSILHHPFVTAELALGSLPDRDRFCASLGLLPAIEPIATADLLEFVVAHGLHGTGLGMVDAHLLASTRDRQAVTLWSSDKRLASQAERLGVAYEAV